MSRHYIQNRGSDFGWIFILGGGYIALRFLGIDPIKMIEDAFGIGTVPATPTTGGTTPQANNPGTTTNPPAGTNTTQTPPPPPSAPSNTDLTAGPLGYVLTRTMVDGIGANSLQSAYQWNYYYNLVKGVPNLAPDPALLFPGNPGDENYTFVQWRDAMVKQGLSGLGGLGMIADIQPWRPMLIGGYGNPYQGGGNVSPLGSERFEKTLY